MRAFCCRAEAGSLGNLGFGAQFVLILGDFLALQFGLDLRLELIERRGLGRAGGVELDHMPAELALHRRLGVLAGLEGFKRLGERRHIVVGGGPTQIAAIGCAAGVLGVFLRQLGELGALFQLGDDVLSFFFARHQDVLRLVFGGAEALDEFVVFGLDLGIGDGMLLQIGVEQRADEDVLTRDANLVLHCGFFVQAELVGFLHHHFTADQLVFHHLFELGRDGLALLLGHAVGDGVGQGLRNGFAIHSGDVLCPDGGGKRAAQCGNGQNAGEFQHEVIQKGREQTTRAHGQVFSVR